MAPYEEIAYRKLDQVDDEQFDVLSNFESANPHASGDIRFIAKHARMILNCVMRADLRPGAKVLDLGCGWGLSLEMIGFTGAHVHAVDIDLQFAGLATKTSVQLQHSPRGHNFQFRPIRDATNLRSNSSYESLHHSVKEWEVVGHMSRFLKPGGKIIFAEKPITTSCFPDWGMRLDPLSASCIRKVDWFETGWSKLFLK